MAFFNHKKKILPDVKSEGSEGHIVNSGFNEVEAEANYRPDRKSVV